MEYDDHVTIADQLQLGDLHQVGGLNDVLSTTLMKRAKMLHYYVKLHLSLRGDSS